MDRFGGNPLPDHVLDSIRQNGVAIKGPITTPVGTGFRSVNVALRKELDMYAQVRPCKIYPGVRTRYADTPVDIVIVRENTEDLYAGIEFERGSLGAREVAAAIESASGAHIREDAGHLDQADLGVRHPPGGAVRVRLRPCPRPQEGHRGAQGKHHEVHRRPVAGGVPRGGGGEHATSSSRTGSSTTCACSSCRSPSCTTCWCCRTSTATSCPTSAPAWSAAWESHPARTSARHAAVFEPTHGSAPKYAGQNKVNPIAMMLSGVLMLQHLDGARRGRSAGIGDRRGDRRGHETSPTT